MRLEALPAAPGQFEALIEELRFRYHKWDVYVGGKLRILPDTLVLTHQEHEEAVACCVGVHDALERAGNRLMNEGGLQDRLGIPKAVQEIIRAETPHHHGIVRYDVIPTTTGWMVPEVNEDAPGGFNETIASKSLFNQLLDSSAPPGDFSARFLDSLPKGRRVGLVYATGYAEDLQHVLILGELLRSNGFETVLASPEHLTCRPFGRPQLLGEPVDWIFRFFPGEWYGYLDNIRAWRRTAARIPVVNPLSRLLRQSKGLFALWREMPLLDEADTDWLNRYTPYTEFFQKDHAPRYLAERETWVLKKLYGRMGDTVVIGRLCKPDAWEKAVAHAAKTPETYIAQHAFVPLSVSNNGRPLFPALGVYLINGRFADYYSRADDVGFTTHEAYYVVTSVENT